MNDLVHDITLLQKLDTYAGQEVCPRCFSGFPCCTDFKALVVSNDHRIALHRLACRRYIFGDLCDECEAEVVL